jgi:hypothetical protein
MFIANSYVDAYLFYNQQKHIFCGRAVFEPTTNIQSIPYFPKPKADMKPPLLAGAPSFFTPQGCQLPFFQFAHRSSSLIPWRALSTCKPQPDQVDFPQSLHGFSEHILRVSN